MAYLIREPANQRGVMRESFRLFALLRDKATSIARPARLDVCHVVDPKRHATHDATAG
jgi:hypothetical protein